MFTNNFYKLLAFVNSKHMAPQYSPTAEGLFGTIIGLDGTTTVLPRVRTNIAYHCFPAFADEAYSNTDVTYLATLQLLTNNTKLFYNSSIMNVANCGGVVIGSGATPPTLNDYCLEAQITEFTAITSVSIAVNSNKVEAIGTYNITNTGTDTFTIREIGIIQECDTNRNLIERTLLANPVTIAPNETGVVTYKITLG